MTRMEFLKGAGASALTMTTGCAFAAEDRYASMQAAIDAVSAEAYSRYINYKSDGRSELKALQELEASFGRLCEEVKATVVTGPRPAVWHVYNMGTIVKTPKTCFSIDLKHRRECELAPCLDFALITHNHGDHFSDRFYRTMDGAHKIVISNFQCNYGAPNWRKGQGGYTRAEKTFKIRDVEIRTSLTDHNDYLVDFTTAFEITVGGYTIYHTGDCSNVKKLSPKLGSPDLWIVHPKCGMDVADGFAKFRPKLTAIEHLNELGHAKWRWSYACGLQEKAKLEALGGAAVVPLWGDRLV